MDHLFPKIEPPKRDQQAKQLTLKKIQSRTAKKSYWNWQYYGAIIASIAIIFVLLASLTGEAPSTSQTSATGSSIKNIFIFEQTESNDEPRTHMSKWYYTDKMTLSKNERQQIAYMFNNRTPVEGDFPTTLNLNYTAFLVQYDNGTEHFYQYDPDNSALFNFTTHEMISLSETENAQLYELHLKANSSLTFVVRFVLMLGLFTIYQWILFKVSPMRKEEAEEAVSGLKSFLVGIGLIAIMFFIVGASAYLYDAHNILFIFAIFALYFLLRKISYWYNGKHYYPFIEVPLGAIFYTAIVFVFYL